MHLTNFKRLSIDGHLSQNQNNLALQIQVLSNYQLPFQLSMIAVECGPQCISKSSVAALDKQQIFFSHDAALWTVLGFLDPFDPAEHNKHQT